MKKFFLFFIAVILYGGIVFAQNTASTVTFVNTGKMYIGGTSSAYGLFVPDAVRTLDSMNTANGVMDKSQILLDGYWAVGGNFYKDCDGSFLGEGNAFVVGSNGITTSTGTIDFVSNRGPGRTITYVVGRHFDRNTEYVAFPNIKLSTNDTVKIPPQMGLDATTITAGGAGRVLLESNGIGSPEKVYDASLRVTGSSVTPGSVIVEKYVWTYRPASEATPALFGFATPFDGTQNAGYFAGNWVRLPEQNANKHTQYVLGNKPSTINPSVIAYDQFLIYPDTKLIPGRAYIIQPRSRGFNYQTLVDEGGLSGSNGAPALYDKDKLVFDGKVYSMTSYTENLFAVQDNLPAYSLTSATTGTTNWLFGNSYTSAISIPKLVDKIVASNYNFYSVMYYLEGGSTSYQPLSINGSGIIVQDLNEIPAMSIFMLRLQPHDPAQVLAAAGNPFQIGKTELVHSTVDYGQVDINHAPGKRNAPGSSNLNNQVIFRITTDDNENVYDLAAIGLRANSSLGNDNNDMAKVYASESSGFQLYTLTAPDANNIQNKLSANGVPLNVETVEMNLKPVDVENQIMILNVRGIETLSSETFWVEDLKTGATHHFMNGEPYVFITNPNDAHERFIVHFKAPEHDDDETGFDNVFASKLNMYAIGKDIFIENLLPNDLGADASIYDVAGKLLDTFKVTDYPKMSYTTKGLVDGAYIVRLYRNNSAESLKLIIR